MGHAVKKRSRDRPGYRPEGLMDQRTHKCFFITVEYVRPPQEFPRTRLFRALVDARIVWNAPGVEPWKDGGAVRAAEQVAPQVILSFHDVLP